MKGKTLPEQILKSFNIILKDKTIESVIAEVHQPNQPPESKIRIDATECYGSPTSFKKIPPYIKRPYL